LQVAVEEVIIIFLAVVVLAVCAVLLPQLVVAAH
jgi:hypothetical protein